MQGKQVTSTPYASPAHTRIHVEFTKSPDFQNMTREDPRVAMMIEHITGELMAQGQRSGQTGELPPGGAVQGNGQQNPMANANGQGPQGANEVLPAMMTGGSQAPAAI